MDFIADSAARIRENIQQVMVGKTEVMNLVIAALLSEGHILLEDVPGTGKTTLAKSLAASLGCNFQRIQFTPDLLPSDVTGLNYFNQKSQDFEFRPGPIMSQIVLADEINRATPRTQSALLEAMQERQLTLEGVTHQLERPFLVMATQNPIELEGTFPLPEAQQDRFLIRLAVGYPSEEEENNLLRRFRKQDPLTTLEPVTDAGEIVQASEDVRDILVGDAVQDYIVKIIRTTRDHPELDLGASPRATLALYRISQAWAAIDGRDYVLPDDAKFLAPYVLTHRVVVSPQTLLRGRTAEQIVEGIVETVPVPVE
ncbi:MAG: MoxR family ATPase [Chloroflexi bacterium]|nr:MoxR family ATPase [Chloroflexota bacterium]